MTATLTPLRGRKPVHWTTLLGLVLVPLTVAAVLLWGLWNPTERLDTVTAAVVNQDKPVEVDGQTVPLGRVLAGELIGSEGGSGSASGSDAERTNFTWVLTDADDAQQGLDEGRYATVVTIPENFSAAATSLSDGPDQAEQAHIDIAESDRGRLVDTALSGIVTQTATSVLNQQLGEQFVGSVFVGMSELHRGIGKAAEGATQLADGGAQLAEGAGSLATGTQQLSDGTQQLAGGAGELANGAGELASGVGQYVGGASQLAEAYRPLGQGAAGAATQLKTTVGALTQLQAESAAPQSEVAEGLGTVGAAMHPQTGLPGDIATLVGGCYTSGASPEFCATLQTTLVNRVTQIGGGLQSVQSGMNGLAAAQGRFEATLGAGGSGGGDASAQLDALIAGLGEFGAGLDRFAGQGAQLAAGASGLAGGASQLATGTSELAAGTPALAEGASQLASGAEQSASGARDLAGGLGEAVSGIPNYTEAQRDKLAETAIAPVEARGGSDELFNASGVPLFAGIALWAGALAMFLVLAPLWRRTREAARGIGRITLRSAVPAVALGAVQGAIAGVVLPMALGYDLGRASAFFGLALLAGIAFALVVQGLSALLGGLGRFIAFVLLVVAFAVGIVSTVPGPLAAVGDASPIGAALGGFQAIATGASDAAGAAVALTLWALGGLALTAFAVARVRKAARAEG
ncbi:YhgE/Pip family protein [Leucobacter sp. VD1]|uniref:YhgE/Pip family protein n=1 Tax=Leucobacter sp. VD1 TaxID=3080381 RepID=UPI003016C279